jgi:phage gp46-like protein
MPTDFKLDPALGDYIFDGDLAVGQDIANNIYLSLMTEKGSHAFNPSFGSRLHLLVREKALDSLPVRAREYCDEALAWIVKEGRADRIEVETDIETGITSRLKIQVTAWQSGQPQPYEYFVEVR